MESKRVTVLDFSTGEVHIYRYEAETEDLETFLEDKGHQLKDIEYMATDLLILQIHE